MAPLFQRTRAECDDAGACDGDATGQNPFFDTKTFAPFVDGNAGFAYAARIFNRIVRASNCRDQIDAGGSRSRSVCILETKPFEYSRESFRNEARIDSPPPFVSVDTHTHTQVQPQDGVSDGAVRDGDLDARHFDRDAVRQGEVRAIR